MGTADHALHVLCRSNILFAVGIFSLLIMLLIMFHFVIHFLCNKRTNNMINKRLGCMPIISALFYCTSHIIALLINCSYYEPVGVIISSVTRLLGRWTMNYLFVRQLKFAFQDTIYSYSAFQFRCIYCMLFLLLLPVIMLCAQLMFNFNHRVTVISYMAFNLFDVIFSFILLHLFQTKLFQLIKGYFVSFNAYKKKQEEAKQIGSINDVSLALEIERDPTHSIVTLSSDKVHKVKISKHANFLSYRAMISESLRDQNHSKEGGIELVIEEKQRNKHIKNKQYDKQFVYQKNELINIMTQYTVLITFILVPTSMLLVILSVAWSAIMISGSLPMLFVFGWFLYLYPCASVLCLYLDFPFSFKLYRFLCLYPHKCLAHLCAKRIDHSLVFDDDT